MPAGFDIGGLRPGNTVFLAPLSGITDVPFRRRARRFGAGLVVSEMVASGELVRGFRESMLRAMRDGDGVHVVQLAGRDPAWMREAAERAADLGADIIDINMGCPAKKVVGGQSGSALMREPDLALRLVDATVAGAGAVPVTLKMRLGWDHQTINSPEIAARAEAAGVRMITVHGRTRQQLYTGSADWRAIAAVKAAVTVPVVANGDLVASGQRSAMLAASGADAVMIGRGTYGRPWFPGLLAGAITLDDLDALSFADFVIDHYEDMLLHYGSDTGLRHSRKHLGWYLDGFAAASGAEITADRAAILVARSSAVAIERLRHVFGDTSIAEIERGTDATRRREAA
ncbi:tRNA dihydrouridine synthase DusB [Aureimonas sp. SA4125]|uniref:tRNA dihydrouridine synthase DusB n=1 Tax=Aureimonas sp. SA4125 TaxID=2826993 RepID=UPI001CC74284|nr:tRNA dihydrouridine synthase DusB [Aureimonas sp. SA4125]